MTNDLEKRVYEFVMKLHRAGIGGSIEKPMMDFIQTLLTENEQNIRAELAKVVEKDCRKLMAKVEQETYAKVREIITRWRSREEYDENVDRLVSVIYSLLPEPKKEDQNR